MNDWNRAALIVFTIFVPFLATVILFGCLAKAIVERRFSLRGLLIATTAVCIIAGILSAAIQIRE
jgi:hypothetical protein